MNDLKRLRHACRERLRGLAIPRPFQLEAFAANVQAQRGGRRLDILPLPVPASESSPYGVWIATTDRDFILHEEHTTPLHRIQICLHELGHMLFDHRPDAVLDDRAARALMPDLDPGVINMILTRHDHSRTEEREAEMLASLVLEQAGYEPRPAAAPDDVLARLSDALGNPVRRWGRGA